MRLTDAARGTYVLRVVNHASVAPTYTVTTAAFDSTIRTTEGRVERYTLTCEKDGKVEAKRKVLVRR